MLILHFRLDALGKSTFDRNVSRSRVHPAILEQLSMNINCERGVHEYYFHAA